MNRFRVREGVIREILAHALDALALELLEALAARYDTPLACPRRERRAWHWASKERVPVAQGGSIR